MHLLNSITILQFINAISLNFFLKVHQNLEFLFVQAFLYRNVIKVIENKTLENGVGVSCQEILGSSKKLPKIAVPTSLSC